MNLAGAGDGTSRVRCDEVGWGILAGGNGVFCDALRSRPDCARDEDGGESASTKPDS